MLTGMFAFALKPHTSRPNLSGLFPSRTGFYSHIPETVLELLYIPALERLYERFVPLRRLQSGVLQQYVLYILITLVALLLCDHF